MSIMPQDPEDKTDSLPLAHCPTIGVCPNCREGWGHWDGIEPWYEETVESRAANEALGEYRFCPHCGDWCIPAVHGVAACGENR